MSEQLNKARSVGVSNTKASFFSRLALREFGLIAALLIMVAFFSVMQPDTFFSFGNLRNVLESAAIPLVLAIGMTYLMIAGQLDLSIGSVLVLSSVVSANTMVAIAGDASLGQSAHVGLALVMGLLSALAAGMVAGLINGLLVTKLRLNSLIVTLGMFGAALGLAQVLADGYNVIGIPRELQKYFGVYRVGGLPAPIWVSAIIALIGGIWLAKTVFGRRTYATGSNPAGARRAGNNVDRHLIILFGLMGLLAGLAGFMDIARFNTTSLQGHNLDNLTVISAVVIGGTSLSGGRGTMLGTVVGVLVPVVLHVGLLILGIEPFWQTFAIGVVLVLAVALDSGQRKQEASRFV